mgnify:FL=1|jgi:hypothetical protein|tara:strand:+ start:960 stop:1193 length:234 start_codon:yes stop_codon:yes gene_type:complete
MKPGIKSTEFIISMVGMVGGVVLASIEGNQWTQMIGAILAAVCGGSYTMGRSLVKSKEALGAAHIEGLRQVAKKPKD